MGGSKMNREETKKILMVIDATYPNFKIENKQQTLDAWHFMLSDYDYNEIALGLKTYITTSGSAFAPSVSELIGMTRKPAELTAIDEVTAWGQVRAAIRKGLYYSRDEFEKLDPDVQRAVGTPDQLREWAQLSSNEIETVIQSNFRRRFETMQKRAQEVEAMPAEVRQLLQNAALKISQKIL